MTRRVVVTGVGALTPVGLNVADTWKALIEGRSGVAPVTAVDAELYTSKVAAEVKGFDPNDYLDKKEAKRMARFVQFAVVASQQAIEDAKLDLEGVNAERSGTIIGVGIGDIVLIEKAAIRFHERGPRGISPFFIPMVIADMASGQVSINFNLKGPNFCTTSACASGTHAIGESFNHIREGRTEVMVCGGAEAAIGNLGFGGFCSMRALSTRDCPPEEASCPFDAHRDGFVMGEGAGVLVLEELEHARRRNAPIYCELVGYGVTADAYHITAPAPAGEGAARAMKMAIKDAGIEPGHVSYINAHGTSTELNDKNETAAIRSVFGKYADAIAVTSSKSMLGHGLGAAGGMEGVVCAMSIKEQMVHPTTNLLHPDPECDLDYVPEGARELELDVVLSNSLGFGGHNAVLAFRRFDG